MTTTQHFDDFEARPGSATSLVRTIVGVFLRDLGGAITSAELVRLLGAVGVSPAHARTAITRVKDKRLLLHDTVVGQSGDGQPGYRLNPDAVPVLGSGDRRIYGYRQQGETESWCLVSFSVPESLRDARHQLRKRLAFIGFGTVAHGLWIAPGYLMGEVEGILDELELRSAATLLLTETPHTAGTLAEAAATWWDLDRIADLHRRFLAATEGVEAVGLALASDGTEATDVAATALDERDAFARYVTAVDEWRILPYVDPGLPPNMLPADWPGFAAVARFDKARALLEAPARAFVGLAPASAYAG